MKRTAAILLLALVALSAFAEEKNRYADSLLHIVQTKRMTDLERAKLYATPSNTARWAWRPPCGAMTRH